MPKGDGPFHVWLNRMAAMRCRAAVVKCAGNQREAARQIGLDNATLWRILKRDNAVLDARAAAENWQPPEALVSRPSESPLCHARVTAPGVPTSTSPPESPRAPSP
jgi:hypothetical protein